MTAVDDLTFRPPTLDDGAPVWDLAGRAGKLDLNASYAYVLWCRDFAATSVVVESDGSIVAFITGYSRPDEPSTLFVWQVAVDPSMRGRGLASRMLDHLVARVEPAMVEATVTPDNEPSAAMFDSLARRLGVEIRRSPLMAAADFPDEHEPEELVLIGPMSRPTIIASDGGTR
jgi:diaminobutyrate-2-oxoglutarate transaminase